MGLIRKDGLLAAAKLVQEGDPVEYEVSRVLAVNVAHDLALFDIGRPVKHCLRFIDGDSPSPGERLLALGYLEGRRRHEATDGLVYEDFFSFAVATEIRDLAGMSGSPVLNAGGRVAGVGYVGLENMLFGIKGKHVKAFVARESGTDCSRHPGLEACLLAGAGQAEEMAAGGDVQAMYELGRASSTVSRIDSSMGGDSEWLLKATGAGTPLRCLTWRAFTSNDTTRKSRKRDLRSAFTAYKWAAEKAAEPQSVFQLGRYYFNGWGTEKDRELALHWLRKARDQGFLPAREYMTRHGLR